VTAANPLVDIGANLTAEAFKNDVHQVIAEGHQAGVTRMILTGSDVADSQAAAELANSYPRQLWSTAGIHPHMAKSFDETSISTLRQLLTLPQVVAVGETGLDYNRNFSEPAQQRASFEAHLQLAAETGMPMFLHQRDAHEDFMALLSAYRSKLKQVVVHCFTGEENELDDYLALDCHIGITGWICDERRGHHLRDFVAKIPADRLMIETDAPYLLPRDLKPKPKSRRNEPKYLPHICEVIAEFRTESASELAALTTATAAAFFRLETS
jgi:TatD DNase family protein